MAKAKELKCGCGGKIIIKTDYIEFYGACSNNHCPLYESDVGYSSEAEAIAAFKKATRYDLEEIVKKMKVKISPRMKEKW
jgi:hypothetical protein